MEDFITRCRVIKCKYTNKAAEDERVLEQLIAGTSIPIQRERLSKEDALTLTAALEVAKSHEATANHMRQMQELTATASTIDAIRSKGHEPCGNCRNNHPTHQCLAYGTTPSATNPTIGRKCIARAPVAHTSRADNSAR